jgi:hypothetical protein
LLLTNHFIKHTMDFEAKIISKHNLDISNVEILANDIANRLNINIEFGQYNLIEHKHNFELLGKITKSESTICSTLYNLTNNPLSSYGYVLELGEEAKLIYKDIISLITPWEEMYDYVKSQNEQKELTKTSYYASVFEELVKLGADEVIFIKESNSGELEISNQDTWDKYYNRISKKEDFFTVPLE